MQELWNRLSEAMLINKADVEVSHTRVFFIFFPHGVVFKAILETDHVLPLGLHDRRLSVPSSHVPRVLCSALLLSQHSRFCVPVASLVRRLKAQFDSHPVAKSAR